MLFSIDTIVTHTDTQDNIMAVKREKNTKLLDEFAQPRFLWWFATKYVAAKRAGDLNSFWSEVGNLMETHDKMFPAGQPLQQPEHHQNVSTGQAPATTPAVVSSTTHNKKPTGHQNIITGQVLPATQIEKPTGQQHILTGQDTIASASVPPASSQLPPPSQPTRPRSPPPADKAMKLHARQKSRSSSLTPSDYVPGHRIGWNPPSFESSKAVGASKAKVPNNFVVLDDEDIGNDSDEYEPPSSIKVKMGTNDKGKGKAKEVTQKEDKRRRKQPERSGVVREKGCQRCVRLKQDCENQKEGVVCYPCAKVKMKCEDQVEGEEVVVEKEKTVKKTKATKPATKPATQQVQRPATQPTKTTPATHPTKATPATQPTKATPATQPKKTTPAIQHTKTTPATQPMKSTPAKSTPASKKTSTIKPISLSSGLSSPAITPPPQASYSKIRPASPPPLASSSKRQAQSPPPQEPKPKRRAAPKKKDEHLPPAAYQSLLERIDKLEKEVESQRNLINAFLPGHFKLKDKMDLLGATTIEIDDRYKKMRGDVENHFDKIKFLDGQVKYLMSESELKEDQVSDDEEVVVVEKGPVEKSKTQSRPAKVEDGKKPVNESKSQSRPATIEDVVVGREYREYRPPRVRFVDPEPAKVIYVDTSPAKEDTDEIEDWPPLASEQEDNAPVDQPVVVEREVEKEGRPADTESPITQLDFTMSAPVGPSVDIPANMPPPPPPSSPPIDPPPPPSTPAVTIEPPTPHTSQDVPLVLPAALLEVPAAPDSSISNAKKRSRSPSPSGSSEPRRSPRIRSASPLPLRYTQVAEEPAKKKVKKN